MPGPIAAIQSALLNAFNFGGRATRAEFWWWGLAQFLLIGAAVAADSLQIIRLYSLSELNPAGLWTFYAVVLTVIPNLSVTVRRLHDTGRSGFWLCLQAVPVIGPILLLFFFLLPSERDSNIYGPGPGGTLPRGAAAGRDRPKPRHDPMNGYAALGKINQSASPETIAANKQMIREYYQTRVLQQRA